MYETQASIRSTVKASSSSSPQSRLVHSSAPNRATLQVIPTAEPEEITLSPIFDIFDVPSKLGQNLEHIRSDRHARPKPQSAELSGNFVSLLPRPPPSTLPPPITFDGPARPRNLPLAFQRRVERGLNSVPASMRQTRQNHTPATPHTTSAPLIELFDGPARLSRYSHKPSNQRMKMVKLGNPLLLFGLAGAVGGVAFLTHNNFPMTSSNSITKRW